jgi:hypothetical protein
VLVKVLTNRLRKVIGNVVSDSWSAFIKGRQILNEILTANEVVDEARKLKNEF